MSRTITPTQVFRRITSLEMYTEPLTALVSTTTSAAEAKLSVSLGVASITGFADLDDIGIEGDGGMELNHISGAPGSGVIVPKYKLAFAQGAGAEIWKMSKVQLGHLEQNGLAWSPSRSLNPIVAATSDTPLCYNEGGLEMKAASGLLNLNGPNILTTLGLADNETGTGTPSDPFQSTIGPNESKLLRTIFRGIGALHNGVLFHVDMINARFEATGSVTMNSQGAASLPLNIGFTQAVFRFYK